jgi:hypothetical protein
MNNLQTLQVLFSNAERKRYTVEFGDGDTRSLLRIQNLLTVAFGLFGMQFSW